MIGSSAGRVWAKDGNVDQDKLEPKTVYFRLMLKLSQQSITQE